MTLSFIIFLLLSKPAIGQYGMTPVPQNSFFFPAFVPNEMDPMSVNYGDVIIVNWTAAPVGVRTLSVWMCNMSLPLCGAGSAPGANYWSDNSLKGQSVANFGTWYYNTSSQKDIDTSSSDMSWPFTMHFETFGDPSFNSGGFQVLAPDPHTAPRTWGLYAEGGVATTRTTAAVAVVTSSVTLWSPTSTASSPVKVSSMMMMEAATYSSSSAAVTSTADTSHGQEPASSKDSTAVHAGIIVGIVLGVLLLVALIWSLIYIRKLKKRVVDPGPFKVSDSDEDEYGVVQTHGKTGSKFFLRRASSPYELESSRKVWELGSRRTTQEMDSSSWRHVNSRTNSSQ